MVNKELNKLADTFSIIKKHPWNPVFWLEAQFGNNRYEILGEIKNTTQIRLLNKEFVSCISQRVHRGKCFNFMKSHFKKAL